MGALALARLEVKSGAALSLEKTADEGGKAVATAIERLTAFIPTEVTTLYLALVALTSDSSNAARWALTGICLVASPISVIAATKYRNDQENKTLKKRKKPERKLHVPWWPMLASFISFALWVLILPGTVASSLSSYDPKLALVVLLLGEFGLGIVDKCLGSGGT